jgi:hypothetical protein
MTKKLSSFSSSMNEWVVLKGTQISVEEKADFYLMFSSKNCIALAYWYVFRIT